MTELFACPCSAADGGAKFVVIAVLFAVWMISLIVSRPRRDAVGTPGEGEGPDPTPRRPLDLGTGEDLGEEIAYRPRKVVPEREIITRPDLMPVNRPQGAQFFWILAVVALVAAIIAGVVTLVVFTNGALSPEPSTVPAGDESETISVPAEPGTQPQSISADPAPGSERMTLPFAIFGFGDAPGQTAVNDTTGPASSGCPFSGHSLGTCPAGESDE